MVIMTMSIALDTQDRIVHINQVERGLACMCLCFECGESVVARKGDKNEHHFSHVSNKESCTISSESILHKFAKQVIIDEYAISLPALPDNENQDAQVWLFDQITAEQSMGRIRPDLVATINNEMIFIEVAVTSFINEDKLALIKQLGIKTVEIDLRDLLKQNIEVPSDAAKDYILNQVINKQWVFPESLPSKSESISVAQTPPSQSCQLVSKDVSERFDKGFEIYRFVINQVWVDVRKFNSGMVSVKCVNFNPEIIQLLKQWRREGRGQYNATYKSWNYFKPFSDTVFERLQDMDMTPKQ